MSGKRNVSVCSGHELANALYIPYLFVSLNLTDKSIAVLMIKPFVIMVGGMLRCFEIDHVFF